MNQNFEKSSKKRNHFFAKRKDSYSKLKREQNQKNKKKS